MDTLTLIIGLAAIFTIGFAMVAACGLAGSHIMKSKGRSPDAGAVLGLLLGGAGLLIALALPAKASRHAADHLGRTRPFPQLTAPAHG